MAFLCPVRIKRAKKLKQDMLNELESPLYASLNDDSSSLSISLHPPSIGPVTPIDCTPTHTLPGCTLMALRDLNSECDPSNHQEELLHSWQRHAERLILRKPCRPLPDAPKATQKMRRFSNNLNSDFSEKASFVHRSSLVDMLSAQLSSVRLDKLPCNSTNENWTLDSSGHSHSQLMSEENLYENARSYENLIFARSQRDLIQNHQSRSNSTLGDLAEHTQEHAEAHSSGYSSGDRTALCESEGTSASSAVYEDRMRESSCEQDELNGHRGSLCNGAFGSTNVGRQSIEEEPFTKKSYGSYVVLYSYVAVDENDANVRRGEIVTVLNKQDPLWYWVVKKNGFEGFVPANFVLPSHFMQVPINDLDEETKIKKSSHSTHTQDDVSHLYHNGSVIRKMEAQRQKDGPHKTDTVVKEPMSDLKILERDSNQMQLVVLFDYDGHAADDLQVRRGEWVFARLAEQSSDGWLWAYSPKSGRSGFIPKAYARPPAMTSL